ncbi:MAG: hypothetical protein KBE09_03310 [Candidatus Pacebacteria bacterium]|nr:hypothetical protein [Candidatus Paceibacterota bacterium]
MPTESVPVRTQLLAYWEFQVKMTREPSTTRVVFAVKEQLLTLTGGHKLLDGVVALQLPLH